MSDELLEPIAAAIREADQAARDRASLAEAERDEYQQLFYECNQRAAAAEYRQQQAEAHAKRAEAEAGRLRRVIDLVIGMLDMPAHERSTHSLPHAVKILIGATTPWRPR